MRRSPPPHQVIKILGIWSQGRQLAQSLACQALFLPLLSGLQGHIFRLCRCSFTLGELSASTVRVVVSQGKRKIK